MENDFWGKCSFPPIIFNGVGKLSYLIHRVLILCDFWY